MSQRPSRSEPSPLGVITALAAPSGLVKAHDRESGTTHKRLAIALDLVRRTLHGSPARGYAALPTLDRVTQHA